MVGAPVGVRVVGVLVGELVGEAVTMRNSEGTGAGVSASVLL